MRDFIQMFFYAYFLSYKPYILNIVMTERQASHCGNGGNYGYKNKQRDHFIG